MPRPETFTDEQSYYATLFHELTHSTGHERRLKRSGITEKAAFGDNVYSKEELVAELSSVLVGANMNILTDQIIKNASAYLKSWTKRMSNKKEELFQGLSHAVKAYDYIIKSSTTCK